MKRTLVVLADRVLGLAEPLPPQDDFQDQLVEAALKDTVARCQGLTPGPGLPPPQLLMAYPDRREWYAQITANFWLLVPQMGATIGQRLDNALLFIAPEPDDETIFIGPRTPQLSARAVQHAFIALGQRGACVGPTPAGGAYAVGIRGRWPTGVMQQVRWHEGRAVADLRRLFRQLRLGVALLDELQPLAERAQLRELASAPATINREVTPFLDQLARRWPD